MGSGARSDGELRLVILQHFVDQGSPPSVEELMGKFRVGRNSIEEALERLDEGRQIKLLAGTHRILMVFPLSALATPYRVVMTDGRAYYGDCAWDAVAVYSMLRKPLRIESFCYHCAEPIGISLGGSQENLSAEGAPVVYLGLPARAWWKDIVRTCSNTMVFFASAEHWQSWMTDHPEANGAAITLEQTLAISEPIYSAKLRNDYSRPSAEQIVSTFRNAGLSGEFWSL